MKNLFVPYKLIDPIYAIIERKEQGIDCTESESAEIKGWLKEYRIVGEQTTEGRIQLLFPQEYDEYLDEIDKLNVSVPVNWSER